MSYPLKLVPRHPGPQPPWYRFRARSDWRRIIRSRLRAKEWNFGVLYGTSCADVEEYKPISVDEARAQIDEYFKCDQGHTQTQKDGVR